MKRILLYTVLFLLLCCISSCLDDKNDFNIKIDNSVSGYNLISPKIVRHVDSSKLTAPKDINISSNSHILIIDMPLASDIKEAKHLNKNH